MKSRQIFQSLWSKAHIFMKKERVCTHCCFLCKDLSDGHMNGMDRISISTSGFMHPPASTVHCSLKQWGLADDKSWSCSLSEICARGDGLLEPCGKFPQVLGLQTQFLFARILLIIGIPRLLGVWYWTTYPFSAQRKKDMSHPLFPFFQSLLSFPLTFFLWFSPLWQYLVTLESMQVF